MADIEFPVPDSLRGLSPKIGIVLGSGLGGFVDAIAPSVSCDYSEIEGLPRSKVAGHAGKFQFGSLGGVELMIAQGRVHIYEGWTAKEAAAQIRFMHQMGVQIVILTNAAGIVNANFKPGRWMLINDHLNLARQSPLTGSASFIDQSTVYTESLRVLLKAEHIELHGTSLLEGTYAWLNGPEYETPAEIRMLRTLGADAVGMSTVPEAIQARSLGMQVLALSCLTNYGAGLSGQALNHEEVMEVGLNSAKKLSGLLENCIPAMIEI